MQNEVKSMFAHLDKEQQNVKKVEASVVKIVSMLDTTKKQENEQK